MRIMVSEVYEALIAAGAPESKAKAAAESTPISHQIATKSDLADLEVRLLRHIYAVGVGAAGITVTLIKLI